MRAVVIHTEGALIMSGIRMNSRREGFALAAALLAMVMIGAIVTGGFFAASQEGQIGRSSVSGAESMMIAEQGMNTVIGAQPKVWFDSLTVDVPDTLHVNAAVVVNGDTLGHYTTIVRRLSSNTYMVVSNGIGARGGRYAGGKRSLASIVRTMNISFNQRSAILSYGGVNVFGSASVDGRDEAPSTWNNCDTVGTRAGIVTRDTANTTAGGSSTITGSPQEVLDTTINADSFETFGDITYTQLATMADKIYSDGDRPSPDPVMSGGACVTSDIDNWGDPMNTAGLCHSYWPVIHAVGDVHISGGTGQGVLLVDGDLTITGGFEFYGVTIIKGTLSSTGTGGHLNGTVMVYDGGSLTDLSRTGGNSLVQFSTCAIQRAQDNLTGVARAFPLRHRSWMDLSAVGVN
jgi:hypothetical protein